MWLYAPSCHPIINKAWNINPPGSVAFRFQNKLRHLKSELVYWNKHVFGKLNNQIQEITSKIHHLSNLPRDHNTNSQIRFFKCKLDQLYDMEESMWIQKSREMRYLSGDKNTKYFHASTIVRRQRNRILCLKNKEGNWVNSENQLGLVINGNFKDLFTQVDTPIWIPSQTFFLQSSSLKKTLSILLVPLLMK